MGGDDHKVQVHDIRQNVVCAYACTCIRGIRMHVCVYAHVQVHDIRQNVVQTTLTYDCETTKLGYVWALAFSPSDNRLAVGSWNGHVYVYANVRPSDVRHSTYAKDGLQVLCDVAVCVRGGALVTSRPC